MNANHPMLPGRSAQRFFDTMFPVNEKTRSEVTEDGGQERNDRAKRVKAGHSSLWPYQ
jgi:hypothetical protein